MRDFQKAFAGVDYITNLSILKTSPAISRLLIVDLCSSGVLISPRLCLFF